MRCLERLCTKSDNVMLLLLAFGMSKAGQIMTANVAIDLSSIQKGEESQFMRQSYTEVNS